MEINESEAIKEYQRGDVEKFGLLYDKYIKKIYNFVYYKTFHKETAEDITSNVFFKALKNIKSFKTGSGTFSAWLYQIARNSIIDYYRSKKSDANIEDFWDISDSSDFIQDADTTYKLREVKRYLKNLKSYQRDIVIMRVWEDMPYSEIANALKKSESNCKMIYSRAIKTLSREMPLALLLYIFTIKF